MLKLQWVSKVAKLQSFPLKSCWIVLTLKTACCLRRRRRRPPSPSPSPSQAVARCAPAPAAPRRIICKDCYNFLPQIIEITSLYSVFFTWHMEIWLKLGKFDKNYWNFDLKLWKLLQHFWGHREAICDLCSPQFIVAEGHNIWKVTPEKPQILTTLKHFSIKLFSWAN